jgi:uncharacterized OsmC-like protein
MMKIKVKKARVFVKSKFKTEGSVLRETVKAVGLGFETRLELESDEPADKVAVVVRNAENGCYVMQCLLNPVAVERTVTLNGAEFDPERTPSIDR